MIPSPLAPTFPPSFIFFILCFCFSLLPYSFAAKQKVHMLKQTPDGVVQQDLNRVAKPTFSEND